MLGQFTFESCDQFASLLVDRALAVEMVVVLGDREHALARNIPSAQNVFEEWNHIVAGFGPPKETTRIAS